MKLKQNVKAELYLLFITFLWGLDFPIMKIGLNYFPTNNFLTYSYLIGTLLFLISFRDECIDKKSLLPGFILGFTLYIAQGLQTWGLNYTTASHSAFITSLSITFAPLFASIIIKEKIRLRYIILLVISIIGLYLLVKPASFSSINLGDFLTVLSALSFGLEVVLIQKYTSVSEYNIYSLAFWQLFFSSLFYIISASLVEGWILDYELLPLTTVLYTGIFAIFLTSVFQYIFQRDTTIQRASIIYAAEPLFGHLSAFIMLGETLDFIGYVGAILMILSIMFQEAVVKTD